MSSEYAKPIMDELNKKFRFFTKLAEHTWLVQSNKDSYCEAFFVHTTCNGYIVMSGDYSGIMLHPYGNNQNELPNWMAGATTISYFEEKVINANYYHKTKEWTSDKSHYDVEQFMVEHYGEDTEEETKEYITKYYNPSEKVQLTKKAIEFLKSLRFNYERGEFGMKEMHDQLNDFDDRDWWEMELGEDYTHQFKWQHKCLVFWANKVLEGAFDK